MDFDEPTPSRNPFFFPLLGTWADSFRDGTAMMDRSPPKPIRLSRVSIAQLMQPEHANNLGHVHGGWIMKLMDEAGALACMRHAQQRVVTVAVDHMTFQEPIRIGDLVIISAEVSHTGRTSMEAEVRVIAENPITGDKTHTNTAYLVYVALDEHGTPVPVPELLAETAADEARMEAARARQAHRLKRREKV